MLLSDLDLRANEITLDSTGLSECTYSPALSIEPVLLLKNELFTSFPELLGDDPQSWDMIGKTEADGLNYFESTISLTYKNPPSRAVASSWNIPDFVECIDCYSVKFKLLSKKKVLKIYDGAFDNYKLPELPEGSRVARQFGIGRHFLDESLQEFRDLYFFHDSQEKVEKFFGRELPDLVSEDRGNTRLFAICYHESSRNILKLKRYLYPSDLDINHPERL